MIKIKQVEVEGEYYPHIPNLFWHSGSFWFNEEKVKEVYNNGSKSILLYGNSKRGVIKLRKFAKRCRIKIFTEPLPF